MKKLIYFPKKGSGKNVILFDPILDILDLRFDYDPPKKKDLRFDLSRSSKKKGSRDHDSQYSGCTGPLYSLHQNGLLISFFECNLRNNTVLDVVVSKLSANVHLCPIFK